MKNTEIIICTEAGKLEKNSQLLVKSIRLLDGAFSKIPIYSYAPRPGNEISDETMKFFNDYDVEHRNVKINTKFLDYPLANKPLVCAYHEKNSNAEKLIFCDSDTLFLNSPESDILGNVDVAIRTVDYENIGVADYQSGINGIYWKELHRISGVKKPSYISTTIKKDKIFSYFNTGLIFVKRKSKIFSKWERNFCKIYTSEVKPSKPFFIEQSSFAATIDVSDVNFKLLPSSYNFPVAFYLRRWRGMFPFSLYDKIHIHYHKSFDEGKGERLLSKLKSRELALFAQKTLLNKA